MRTCVYSEEVLANQKGESFCGSGNCVCPKNEDAPGNPELASHEWCSKKAVINGTTPYITAIFGFTLAGLVIKDILKY